MGEVTKISWTQHTHNPLFPKFFSTSKFAQIAYAIWLIVDEFMARMAQGYPIRYHMSSKRKIDKWENVVCAKVSTPFIPAMLANVGIPFKNSRAPYLIFRLSPIVEVPLALSIFIGIMVFASWSTFFSDLRNERTGFGCMRNAKSRMWRFLESTFCGGSNFCTRFRAHLFPFHWGDECLPTFYPCGTEFGFSFF